MSLDNVTPGDKIPEAFNVIIEIPMNGDPIKYEVDKESGAIFVDRFMNTAMHYPTNYGYVPKTIVYSLGNFVFDGFDYPEAQRGWLLRLKLDKTGVLFWETLAAQIDDAGTPWPASGAFTPCGRMDEEIILACQNP